MTRCCCAGLRHSFSPACNPRCPKPRRRAARSTASCSACTDAIPAHESPGKEPSMLTLLWILAILFGALALAYVNASGVLWSAAIAAAIGVGWGTHVLPVWLALAGSLLFVLLAIPLNIP